MDQVDKEIQSETNLNHLSDEDDESEAAVYYDAISSVPTLEPPTTTGYEKIWNPDSRDATLDNPVNEIYENPVVTDFEYSCENTGTSNLIELRISEDEDQQTSVEQLGELALKDFAILQHDSQSHEVGKLDVPVSSLNQLSPTEQTIDSGTNSQLDRLASLRAKNINVKVLQKRFTVCDETLEQQGSGSLSSVTPPITTDQYCLAQPTNSNATECKFDSQPKQSQFKIIESEPSSSDQYSLAQPVQTGSDLCCLAQPIESEGNHTHEAAHRELKGDLENRPESVFKNSVDSYVTANLVDKTFNRKPVKYKYRYDPPWNNEFPVVMVPVQKGQNIEMNQSEENTDQTVFIDNLQENLGASGNFEQSGTYNHLFEGSVSEQPKISSDYGDLYAVPAENEPGDYGDDGQDSPRVPSLPIYLSSGVYANAYQSTHEGMLESMKSRSQASIRSNKSQENPYEDVVSRISSDFGWNDSEFSASDSGTDYENSPGPESGVEFIDKPLPPTPREIKNAEKTKPQEANKKNGNAHFLPVNVNLEKHPPPCLPPAPEDLEKHQMKRRFAIQSLVDSEKSYIDTLWRLSEEYKNTLMTTFGLQHTPVEVILDQAEQILNIHQMFQIELAEKVNSWDKKEEIGNIFIGFFSREMVIELYSVYVNNFSGAMEELKSLQSSRTALANFLTEMAIKSPDRLPLFGLLVKPVQRFPQFITILQDILKHTPHKHHDRSSLQTALTDLENVAHKLNEAKRVSEQKLQAKKVAKTINIQKFRPRRLLRQDDLEQICETGNTRTKTRRLFLTDSHLICTNVTYREQDRIRQKWAIPLSELELKDNSISPDLSCSVKANGGLLSIHTRRETFYQESDPLNLQNDLENMVHDITVLGQVVSLVSTLKCSYENVQEEVFIETINDLQRKIQVKNQQLQILNSCTILLEHTNSQNKGKEKYTFQTLSPELKQEWSTDFLLAKLSLDPSNSPSWTCISGEEDVSEQPAVLMKHLPVDMPRYFTKMKCAVPVFLATHGSSDIGIQHLWVVMTTDLRTQVALVSVQNTKPSLVESFQAAQAEVVAVEIVPGYAVKESSDAFMEDTVWMSTNRKEVLVFSVFNEQGLRDQSQFNRKPKKVFSSHGVGLQIHYTIERVFIGTDDGILVIYDRDKEGVWNFECPNIVQLASSPINSVMSVDEEVWVACGQHTYIIPVEESYFLVQIEMPCKEGGSISHMVRSGVGLWISHERSSSVHLYHIETKSHIQEINVAQSVSSLVQNATDPFIPQEQSCTITSLMTSKGFLWVGTSSGVLLTFPLPRLKDGVPIISGRPFVSYHGHNGPVQFLIPIYCGTVNLWHKAKGLDYNTSFSQQSQGSVLSPRDLTGSKMEKGEPKQNSVDEKEAAVSQDSSESDYIQMTHKPTPPQKPSNLIRGTTTTTKTKTTAAKSTKTTATTSTTTLAKNRLSRSMDNLTDLLPPKQDTSLTKGRTLKLPRQLAARQNVTKTLNSKKSYGEDDVYEVYRDLMRNESMTAPVNTETKVVQNNDDKKAKPQNPEGEKKSSLSRRMASFNIRNRSKSRSNNDGGSRNEGKNASVRVSSDEYRLRALDTLSKRGCNSVMIVMGGDGYIDWRKKSSSVMKNLEAALIIWLYKF